MFMFQYFVFDKSGNQILDANAIMCDSLEEAYKYRDEFVKYYKTSGEMNDNQLSLFALGNGTRECLFSSNEQ